MPFFERPFAGILRCKRLQPKAVRRSVNGWDAITYTSTSPHSGALLASEGNLMADEKKYIGVDLGAESGRVMLGTVAEGKLVLEEMHRFGNGPVEENGTLRWDFDKLLAEIKEGISKAVKAAGGTAQGIGIDTWGVDFGLVDAEGKLLEKPYNYRDSRTEGMLEKAFEIMGKRPIYDNTGIQFMVLNTVYQLLSMRLSQYAALPKTDKLVMMADLFAYALCGRIVSEYTLASTTQLMDMRTGQWSQAVFEGLDLPMDIMPEIIQPGEIVGKLTGEVAAEIGCERLPVIAIGTHDTASAVAAVPAQNDNWAYLSSGTWSLMGVEISQPIINDKTFEHDFTNEGGVAGTIRLLKNIMGLWLVQECRRQWHREGTDLNYDQITQMAEAAKPFAAFIDVDDTRFLAPGDMPARINEVLTESGQAAITDKGQMIRVVLESLAIKYRSVMEMIESATGTTVEVLHIVGGGIQNELLCRFTADALGKKVITGPIEATASGNILMQALATGQIGSLSELRQIVANSFDLKTYEPQDVDLWAQQYERHKKGKS